MANMPYVSTASPADPLDGDYPVLFPSRPNAASLRTTADYHRSLLEERQDSASFNSRKPQDGAGPQYDDNEAGIDLTAALHCKSWKPSRREKAGQQETTAAGLRHPELTQQDLEEFESLPLAIRRKVSLEYSIYVFRVCDTVIIIPARLESRSSSQRLWPFFSFLVWPIETR